MDGAGLDKREIFGSLGLGGLGGINGLGERSNVLNNSYVSKV